MIDFSAEKPEFDTPFTKCSQKLSCKVNKQIYFNLYSKWAYMIRERDSNGKRFNNCRVKAEKIMNENSKLIIGDINCDFILISKETENATCDHVYDIKSKKPNNSIELSFSDICNGCESVNVVITAYNKTNGNENIPESKKCHLIGNVPGSEQTKQEIREIASVNLTFVNNKKGKSLRKSGSRRNSKGIEYSITRGKETQMRYFHLSGIEREFSYRWYKREISYQLENNHCGDAEYEPNSSSPCVTTSSSSTSTTTNQEFSQKINCFHTIYCENGFAKEHDRLYILDDPTDKKSRKEINGIVEIKQGIFSNSSRSDDCDEIILKALLKNDEYDIVILEDKTKNGGKDIRKLFEPTETIHGDEADRKEFVIRIMSDDENEEDCIQQFVWGKPPRDNPGPLWMETMQSHVEEEEEEAEVESTKRRLNEDENESEDDGDNEEIVNPRKKVKVSKNSSYIACHGPSNSEFNTFLESVESNASIIYSNEVYTQNRNLENAIEVRGLYFYSFHMTDNPHMRAFLRSLYLGLFENHYTDLVDVKRLCLCLWNNYCNEQITELTIEQLNEEILTPHSVNLSEEFFFVQLYSPVMSDVSTKFLYLLTEKLIKKRIEGESTEQNISYLKDLILQSRDYFTMIQEVAEGKSAFELPDMMKSVNEEVLKGLTDSLGMYYFNRWLESESAEKSYVEILLQSKAMKSTRGIEQLICYYIRKDNNSEAMNLLEELELKSSSFNPYAAYYIYLNAVKVELSNDSREKKATELVDCILRGDDSLIGAIEKLLGKWKMYIHLRRMYYHKLQRCFNFGGDRSSCYDHVYKLWQSIELTEENKNSEIDYTNRELEDIYYWTIQSIVTPSFGKKFSGFLLALEIYKNHQQMHKTLSSLFKPRD